MMEPSCRSSNTGPPVKSPVHAAQVPSRAPCPAGIDEANLQAAWPGRLRPGRPTRNWCLTLLPSPRIVTPNAGYGEPAADHNRKPEARRASPDFFSLRHDFRSCSSATSAVARCAVIACHVESRVNGPRCFHVLQLRLPVGAIFDDLVGRSLAARNAPPSTPVSVQSRRRYRNYRASPTMVTMERPTPSADGAPPPDDRVSGRRRPATPKPAMTWSMIFISTAIARTAGIAKGRSSGDRAAIQAGPREGAVLAVFPNRRSHGREMMIEAVIWDFGGRAHHVTLRGRSRRSLRSNAGYPPILSGRTNASNHWEKCLGEVRARRSGSGNLRSTIRGPNRSRSARRFEARTVLPLLSGDLRPEMVEALRRIGTELKNGVHHQ